MAQYLRRTVKALFFSSPLIALLIFIPSSAAANEISAGDIVVFGEYKYVGVIDGEYKDLTYPAEWITLETRDGSALLLSEKILGTRMYHEDDHNNDVTWETSDMRGYLNGGQRFNFYDETFTDDEKARILDATVVNDDNPWFGTPGGNDTTDKIFLLSLDELIKYLGEESWAVRAAEDSTRIMGADGIDAESVPYFYGSAGAWWLRTPGRTNGGAVVAKYNIEVGGLGVGNGNIGVRPAMWITLDGAAAPSPQEPAGPGLNIGDYMGDVLYSDITAYINGFAVPVSVTNGKTMVVAEDLRNYGFSVEWNAASMSLGVTPNPGAVFTPLPAEENDRPVGEVKCPYVYTDIKTYLSGEQVESFAIDGQTLIDFELLAKYGYLEWNGDAREIKLIVN